MSFNAAVESRALTGWCLAQGDLVNSGTILLPTYNGDIAGVDPIVLEEMNQRSSHRESVSLSTPMFP